MINNSGAYIGRFGSIKILLDKYMYYINNEIYCDYLNNNCDSFDDQRTLSKIFLDEYYKPTNERDLQMVLDYNQILFTSLSHTANIEEIQYYCDQGLTYIPNDNNNIYNYNIINTITGKDTCTIHGNGGINAKIYWKMVYAKIKYNFTISSYDCFILLASKRLMDRLGIELTHNLDNIPSNTHWNYLYPN